MSEGMIDWFSLYCNLKNFKNVFCLYQTKFILSKKLENIYIYNKTL